MRMAHLGVNDHNICLFESRVSLLQTDSQGNFFYCKHSPEGTGLSSLLSHLVVLVLLPAGVPTPWTVWEPREGERHGATAARPRAGGLCRSSRPLLSELYCSSLN